MQEGPCTAPLTHCSGKSDLTSAYSLTDHNPYCCLASASDILLHWKGCFPGST